MHQRILSISLVSLLSLTIANAQNWPQWRGPLNRSAARRVSSALTAEENITGKALYPAGAAPQSSGDRMFLNVADGDDLYLSGASIRRRAQFSGRATG